MKQQKIKQLALLGLASGLLAATATAEAADKPANPRAANARSQPIAGCGSACGSIADNYNPSASCGAPSSPRPYNQNQNFAGCSSPTQPGYVSYTSQNDPRDGQLIQAGCASHQYEVNSPNEQYDPERHGRPNLSVQTQQEPQSSFRYLGDTTQPPNSPSQSSNSTTYRSTQSNGSNQPIQSASRPNNSSRYLSDTTSPSTSSTSSSTSSYPSSSSSSYPSTSSSTSTYPSSSSSSYPSTPSTSSYPSTSTSSTSSYPSTSSSYSSSTSRNASRMSDDSSMNNASTPSNNTTPPKTETSKKTFW